MGSTCAAIQYGKNDTRIYFQGTRGHLYESRGREVSRAHYKTKTLVDPDGVRPQTPIAVIIHAHRVRHLVEIFISTHLTAFTLQIHVYYINSSNHIAEMRSKVHDSSSFEVGSKLRQKNQLAAYNSGFLYAISDYNKIRVGYQTGETQDYGKVHELEFSDNVRVWIDVSGVNLGHVNVGNLADDNDGHLADNKDGNSTKKPTVLKKKTCWPCWCPCF